ncbi:hypothetical protein [Nocardioides sp.]|uniref:LpxL/LpxP family acyltransferase n=1 Tax=Nocardioides sp. TaxID=35761 RepID=UPI003563A73C
MSAIKKAAVAAVRRAPLPLATPLVRRRIRKVQRDPQLLEVAHTQMEFLLGASQPDADLDAAARRHLEYVMWRRELRWHPDVITKQSVLGMENLTKERGPTGGLLFCFIHHGRYEGSFGAIKRAGGPPLTVVVHPDMVKPIRPVHVSAHLVVAERGAECVSAELRYTGIRDLVTQGKTVGIAVDQPGSTKVRFLGRDLLGPSGGVRIAFETETPMVLLTARHTSGHDQEVTISEPLRPADFADPADMLQSILTRCEPSVLAWPEAYDWPKPKFTMLDVDGQPIPHVRAFGEPDF